MNYTFEDRLSFSRGVRELTDIETLKAMIDGAVSVEKTDTEQDKAGVDYVVTLRRGGRVLIDAKARERGASKYWRNGPEVALETWSVVGSKVGWTLCEKKETDLILFTFDPQDSPDCWLVSFQLLRMAFRRNLNEWRQKYKTGKQNSGAWESECVFVPISVVDDAIRRVQRGQLFMIKEPPHTQPALIGGAS